MPSFEFAIYHDLADAYKAADYGTLYIYVSSSKDDGWLSNSEFPELCWFEKLVLVDQNECSEFLNAAGANEPFALVGVSQGFLLFVARNTVELLKHIELTRPWVESLIQANINRGEIDPKTYRFPISEKG